MTAVNFYPLEHNRNITYHSHCGIKLRVLFYIFLKENVPKHTSIEIKEDYANPLGACLRIYFSFSAEPRLQVLSTDAWRGEVLYCL